MLDLTITEVLPEGDDCAWITLNDGMTRLIGFRALMALQTHQALRLRRLIRCPRIAPDGIHIVWPDGSLVDVLSVRDAPHGPLPLELNALIRETQRYRPLAALLRACEPPLPNYLDVQPTHVIAARLSLTSREMDSILEGHRPAKVDQVAPRLSDLSLLLTGLVPDGVIGGLLRRSWPYGRRHSAQNPLLDTALGCLRAGRIDLVEAPLVQLLLPNAFVEPAGEQ